MKVLLFFLSMILWQEVAVSQTNDTAEARKKLESLKGTYEIRRIVRDMPMLPSNLADIIITNRKEKVLNVVKLNETTELVIYPASASGRQTEVKTGAEHD